MSRDGALDRAVLLPIAALGLFLFMAALALGKPGLPSTLRADEAAHLLQTSSLAVDGDLRIDAQDIERLFTAYPYGGPVEVPLRWEDGDDGFTVDRPAAYAVVAAPWRAVFGVNGPLALNVLLAFCAILSLTAHLKRSGESSTTAATVGVAAVALSALFPYFYWHHPAMLWLALGAAVVAPTRRFATTAAGGAA
ncbi:MAG: hypothetical protein AAFY88_11935, partial [Acidobacteriota bacterium]